MSVKDSDFNEKKDPDRKILVFYDTPYWLIDDDDDDDDDNDNVGGGDLTWKSSGTLIFQMHSLFGCVWYRVWLSWSGLGDNDDDDDDDGYEQGEIGW